MEGGGGGRETTFFFKKLDGLLEYYNLLQSSGGTGGETIALSREPGNQILPFEPSYFTRKQGH